MIFRRLIGRFGLWLLTRKLTSAEKVNFEFLSRKRIANMIEDGTIKEYGLMEQRIDLRKAKALAAEFEAKRATKKQS